jgi:hypothetical protein
MMDQLERTMKMSFDLEVAHKIVEEMRATDWLKYEANLKC